MTENTVKSAVIPLLTIEEAAAYLKVSRSWLYQNKHVPRHRIPGSRGVRFFQEELEAWLRGRLPSERGDQSGHEPHSRQHNQEIDFSAEAVYHRNPRYR